MNAGPLLRGNWQLWKRTHSYWLRGSILTMIWLVKCEQPLVCNSHSMSTYKSCFIDRQEIINYWMWYNDGASLRSSGSSAALRKPSSTWCHISLKITVIFADLWNRFCLINPDIISISSPTCCLDRKSGILLYCVVMLKVVVAVSGAAMFSVWSRVIVTRGFLLWRRIIW